MQSKRKPSSGTRWCQGASVRARLGAAALAFAVVPPAMAIELSTDNPDLTIRWDNTVKYSAAFRTQDVSGALVGKAQANEDDGDRNFGKGLVSNRVDLFTEADVVYNREFGVRISAAAWYDDVYNRTNNNDSPRTVNSISVQPNTFTAATRDLMGQKAELLDAFVFGGVDLGDMHATGRLGKHALLWGESLFFGSNGIAGGMAPVDIVKQLSVPGSQFKEIIRPVNQLSGQLQVNPELSLGAYYQLEWQPNRIPAAGSYLSASDVLDVGGERLFWATGSSFVRGQDLLAKNSGQYGLQMRFRPIGMEADFGLYAIQYNDKGFQTYIRPTAGPGFFGSPGGPGAIVGDYVLAYHEGIRAYGASTSTSVGDANVGVEVSVRDNTPLVNAGVFALAPNANNSDNPAYPVGRSGHAQASTVLLLSPSSLWQGGSLLAEVAWNRLLEISKNPQSLDPNATRDAWGFRVVLAPAYYQVMPGLDITVPIGLGYNPKGRSSVVNQFNGGVDKGGDFSVGVSGEYQKRFRFSVSYTSYIGSEGAYFSPSNDRLSYQQKYADRNFLSLNIQTTF